MCIYVFTYIQLTYIKKYFSSGSDRILPYFAMTKYDASRHASKMLPWEVCKTCRILFLGGAGQISAFRVSMDGFCWENLSTGNHGFYHDIFQIFSSSNSVIFIWTYLEKLQWNSRALWRRKISTSPNSPGVTRIQWMVIPPADFGALEPGFEPRPRYATIME